MNFPWLFLLIIKSDFDSKRCQKFNPSPLGFFLAAPSPHVFQHQLIRVHLQIQPITDVLWFFLPRDSLFLWGGKYFWKGAARRGAVFFSGGHHLSEIRKSSTHKKITAESSSKHHSEIRICIRDISLRNGIQIIHRVKISSWLNSIC